MELKIIYEDENVLVIDKPPGIIVFPEKALEEKTLIEYIIKQYPRIENVGNTPRCGTVHRLDRDTSGILLVAKNTKILEFLQKQFQERKVVKKYTALVVGQIKEGEGKIETLIGRSPKNRLKQKVYSLGDPKGKRKAETYYKVIKKFEDYTLLEVEMKTGRRHQIRCHMAYINHPIAGDKLYGFKNQPSPESLTRQFLHASYLKVKLPDNKEKEFRSELPDDLKEVINKQKDVY